jgi:mono/diheme cytochrome c family protein
LVAQRRRHDDLGDLDVKRFVLILMLFLLAGCRVSMTQQNRYHTYSPAKLWADGTSARPLPAHTVAQGDLKLAREAAQPPPVTPALLQRGRQRFDIYCSPCHGIDGKADGIVVERGFPKPPSYFEPRLMAAPASTFFDAITNGYGVMYSYAARVPPHDRWAIIAYIRALQLSQHATLAEAPQAKEKLR